MLYKNMITAMAYVACAIASFSLSFSGSAHGGQSNDKLVSVYLLIDDNKQLQQYIQDLSKIDKPNFNRIIFSFVKPTLTQYQSGSLANTGIMGYFDAHDGKGVDAFQNLKKAVALSKQKNIEAFLSVGGWNYSCNYALFGERCGMVPSAANGIHYDWFPDPTEPAEKTTAQISYTNLVRLTKDLGMDGIDFDYEEFWHADQYAITWGPSATGEWSTDIARSIVNAGGPSYETLMEYGTHSGSSFVMPKTVDKVSAILHAIIDSPDAKGLKFAAAVPPVGARPTTGFVYSDSAPDIYTKGGLWWKGNLKGLWYHLNEKDPSLMAHFDSLGLMTYDLCGDNPQVCAPYAGASLDLPSQVAAYMKDYINWLKEQSQAPSLAIDNIGKVTFLPAKYMIKAKIQFGFEVSQPAYPQNPAGQLQLTNRLVDQITQEQHQSDGVIIWQLYAQQNKSVPGATTSQYTLNKSCKTFLAHDTRYDCNANFPQEKL
ncbi:MAG: hypothetical protein J0I93_02940 [Legionella sp.]|nr:hypothetical protein [Legionella sp.]